MGRRGEERRGEIERRQNNTADTILTVNKLFKRLSFRNFICLVLLRVLFFLQFRLFT